MPLEGATEAQAQTTSDATAKTTGAETTEAGTQAAHSTEGTPSITDTPEFKSALTAAIEAKIPQLKRSLAKSITGEKETKTGDGDANLQTQLQEMQGELRTFKAKDSVRSFITDPKNKLNVPSDAISGIEELVINRLEFGDDGKPTNVKEAIDTVRASFPRLFANQPSSINAAEGRTARTGPVNMNDFIRRAAGHGN